MPARNTSLLLQVSSAPPGVSSQASHPANGGFFWISWMPVNKIEGCPLQRPSSFGFLWLLSRRFPVDIAACGPVRFEGVLAGDSGNVLGFAQKILGGHRPPLQLRVRNCRGAL